MKVLVATNQTQGWRENDFCFCIEGELVCFGSVCSGEEDPDSSCGCSRVMTGFDSHKATTTVKVIELNMTPDDYALKYAESLQRAGWRERVFVDECVLADIDNLIRLGNSFPTGSVIEIRGPKIIARKSA